MPESYLPCPCTVCALDINLKVKPVSARTRRTHAERNGFATLGPVVARNPAQVEQVDTDSDAMDEEDEHERSADDSDPDLARPDNEDFEEQAAAAAAARARTPSPQPQQLPDDSNSDSSESDSEDDLPNRGDAYRWDMGWDKPNTDFTHRREGSTDSRQPSPELKEAMLRRWRQGT